MTAKPDLAPPLQAERHAALRRLAASLAHAIGSPLNVISGRAELIELDTQELPEVLESAETIRRQVKRITGILRGTLSFFDDLDPTLPQGNVSELRARLLDSAHAEGWAAALSLAGSESGSAFRVESVLSYVLRLCRLAVQLGHDVEVNLDVTETKTTVQVQLSSALELANIRSALEPWLPPDDPAAPGLHIVRATQLTARDAVQLSIALGCAKDTGAELELTHGRTTTSLTATWYA